ncbi:MAG: serine--tRNA ligase [Alphaproteobacteria bacterium]
MFDLKAIRADPAAFDAGLKKRGFETKAAQIGDLDDKRRELQTRLQALLQRRNEASRAIGQAKGRGEDGAGLVAEVAQIKDDIRALEDDERAAAAGLDALLAGQPNTPEEAVPKGVDESANLELRRSGEPRGFDFTVKEHFEIGEALGCMDFESAARMSGARFVVLSGALARMERALAAFMLDMHTGEFGYNEVNPPLLVREAAAFGTGNLPKFADDLFRTRDDYYLIPTAEMSLTNLTAGEIVDEARLPIRVTAFTPCFRAEAGAAGKDTRGMMRQHQFTKVELVSICLPEKSDEELDRMTACAEEVLKRLDLPYRVVLLCGGEMGFAARKTYDIEVWLPGQGRYREISSCSNCGDFQARRMKARYRGAGERGTSFVHTLNGSALAIGRTLIAVLENYQEADGSETIPPALRSYMDGLERIAPGD